MAEAIRGAIVVGVLQGLARAMMPIGLGLLAIAPGCSGVIRGQERRLVRGLEREGLHRREVQVGQSTVELWEGGEGPPLLLLHGFGASAPWQWHHQVKALRPGRRVVVPNLVWFGGSRTTSAKRGIQLQVDAVAGVCDALGVSGADVVGISYGGMVGYELATARPELVGRLVLMDSPGNAHGARDQQAMLTRFGASSAQELFLPTEPEGITTLMEIAYWNPPWTPKNVRKAVLRELYTARRREQSELLAGLKAEMGEADRPKPQQPVLVVWGEGDEVFPLSMGQEVAADLGAPIAVIERARHAPNLERPDAVNAAILGFLGTPTDGGGHPTGANSSAAN